MMETLPRRLSTAARVAVQLRGVRRRYGGTVALAGVDLDVPEGAVYVLIGANGAGKTTAFKVLLDLVVPDTGTATVHGIDTRADGPRARAQIGYVPERADGVTTSLRVGDLIRSHAAYYRAWDTNYARELCALFEVTSAQRFSALSKGQQRRVQLLLALAHRPPVLLLDEPMDGLDPVMRDAVQIALTDHLARFPTTILLSTHQVQEAERLGDHLGVMVDGRIDTQFTREDLRMRLRRYQVEVPDGWTGAASLGEAVIAGQSARRERHLTIWGEEHVVTEQLRADGAIIHRVETLTLEAAALALLGRSRLAQPQEADVHVHAGV